MLDKLKSFHEKELNDYKTYLAFSNEIPEEYSSIFIDLAEEEKSHALIIESIINDYNKHCLHEDTNISEVSNSIEANIDE